MSELLENVKFLLQHGRESEARALLLDRMGRDPRDFEPVVLLVGIMTNGGQWQAAVECIEDRLGAGGPVAELNNLLGSTLTSMGRMQEAEAAYLRVLEARPEQDSIYRMLSRMRKFSEADDLLERIEKRLAQLLADERDATREDPVRTDSLIELLFAAGKLCDDAAAYDRAFSCYAQANARVAAQRPFSAARHAATVEEHIRVFDAGFFARRRGFGSASDVPVLIVGMPRSGTTLMEQMLAAHPKVLGAGELQDLHVIAELTQKLAGAGYAYPQSVRYLRRETAAALGTRYVDRMMREVGSGAVDRVVDKNPQNFLMLGLLELILPNAKIIHMRRHPLDNLLSCYFQYFSVYSTGLSYTYSLPDWCRFYRGYRRLMAHWGEVLPGRVLDVDYEELVGDPEQQLRRVLDHCGLPWDESCLRFNSNAQAIRTASNWQVRQPLHRGSVSRWRHYEKPLSPAIDELREFL